MPFAQANESMGITVSCRDFPATDLTSPETDALVTFFHRRKSYFRKKEGGEKGKAGGGGEGDQSFLTEDREETKVFFPPREIIV